VRGRKDLKQDFAVSQPGKLYLLPVPINEEPEPSIPESNIAIISTLTTFIAENAKTARRHLKFFRYPDISKAEIHQLNEHTGSQELSTFIKLLREGRNVGLMSEAGCPGIADPGADVVRLAHLEGIQVLPLSGPSSIMLAVMASGFNGQNFAFVGYLPVERPLRIKRIRELELLAGKQKQAQFFIETPYRNGKLLESLLEVLEPSTLLFIGRSLLSGEQLLRSAHVSDWKRGTLPDLQKAPAVFGIYRS
jgi:16S rRNA (cytidine1402-2'-O)-methyltransferase